MSLSVFMVELPQNDVGNYLGPYSFRRLIKKLCVGEDMRRLFLQVLGKQGQLRTPFNKRTSYPEPCISLYNPVQGP